MGRGEGEGGGWDAGELVAGEEHPGDEGGEEHDEGVIDGGEEEGEDGDGEVAEKMVALHGDDRRRP